MFIKLLGFLYEKFPVPDPFYFFVVNFIHNDTSKVKFTARYSVFYHFTIRPFAGKRNSENGWTDGGTNEST